MASSYSRSPRTSNDVRDEALASPTAATSRPTSAPNSQLGRTRTNTATSRVSTASGALRRASIKLLEADVPLGAWAASANATAKAPSIGEIRGGAYSHQGWHGTGQLDRRASQADMSEQRRLSRTNSGFSRNNVIGAVPVRVPTAAATDVEPYPSTIDERATEEADETPMALPGAKALDSEISEKSASDPTGVEPATGKHKHKHHSQHHNKPKEIFPADVIQPNGYVPPPKIPWTHSFLIGLKGFWRWFLTPLGFFITVYALNVVAWGGMLFLLLIQAAPAMCHPSCADLSSPRRKWIEVDSQILNALFCVTGFGLIPWRFRDLYWLLVYRIGLGGRNAEHKMIGLRRLAGIHNGWFRLQGSQNWRDEALTDLDETNPAVPLPLSKRLDPPLTGIRAPPTATWKLDFVIWGNVWNTFFQVCLCGFMWGRNRFNRPSWSTGLFIALACIVAGAAGIMMFVEGKKVKRYEGVQPNEEQQRLMREANFQQQGESGLGAMAQAQDNLIRRDEK